MRTPLSNFNTHFQFSSAELPEIHATVLKATIHGPYVTAYLEKRQLKLANKTAKRGHHYREDGAV